MEDVQTFEAHRAYLDRFDRVMDSHLKAITSFALSAIRGTFLLNGAASVTALSIGEFSDTAVVHIVTVGAWGAVCAVICAGLSYMAQRIYMDADLYLCNESFAKTLGRPISAPRKLQGYRMANFISGLACLAFFASVSIFIYSLLPLSELLKHS
jgi:hypothetical protein